jgi:hypothetical protein
MMKAQANKGATGENAIVRNAGKADVILDPLSIVLSNVMRGELTSRMADAVASSPQRNFSSR